MSFQNRMLEADLQQVLICHPHRVLKSLDQHTLHKEHLPHQVTSTSRIRSPQCLPSKARKCAAAGLTVGTLARQLLFCSLLDARTPSGSSQCCNKEGGAECGMATIRSYLQLIRHLLHSHLLLAALAVSTAYAALQNTLTAWWPFELLRAHVLNIHMHAGLEVLRPFLKVQPLLTMQQSHQQAIAMLAQLSVAAKPGQSLL